MAMRSFTTSKGTELPLLNLKGKEYLEVKYRLVWFREDHPDWSIETELMSVTDVSAYARATIRDESGRIIATSHKFESIQGFPDFIEKAETGSIGRALALIGYGTQFCADELDEGRRIVDSPVPTRPSARKFQGDRNSQSSAPLQEETPPQEESATEAEAAEPGDYIINFGRKYKGKKLRDVPQGELQSYIDWLESNGVRPGTALAHQLNFLKNAFDRMYSGAPKGEALPAAASH